MHLFLCFFLANSPSVDRAIKSVLDSGRVTMLYETDGGRLENVIVIPPGVPPVLSFRYMEGSRRHGFNGLDLVIDDAGH